MKHNRIVIQGHLISYYTKYEHTNNNAVIFLHGWRSSAYIWEKLLKHFYINDTPFYFIDLPGFGKSENPSSPFSTHNYAEIITEFIKSLNLTKPTLVGHSFGGRIAIMISITHPDLIKNLVLINSAGIVRKTIKKKLIRLIAFLTKPLFSLPFMLKIKTQIYSLLGADDYLSTPELRPTLKIVTQEDLSPLLYKILCPTHIIWGDNDLDTPIRDAYTMKNSIQNSTLSIIKEAGHFSFLDKPKLVANEITYFISNK
jgi:pimeloyl-ACP methyl ester carboxylesterase